MPLKITLCSITQLAPNQNSNAKTVAFHHRAPLPVCFPPSPKESHSRGYLPNLKALSPTSKTYRISNQVLKTGIFFFFLSTPKAFPQKIFDDRRANWSRFPFSFIPNFFGPRSIVGGPACKLSSWLSPRDTGGRPSIPIIHTKPTQGFRLAV